MLPEPPCGGSGFSNSLGCRKNRVQLPPLPIFSPYSGFLSRANSLFAVPCSPPSRPIDRQPSSQKPPQCIKAFLSTLPWRESEEVSYTRRTEPQRVSNWKIHYGDYSRLQYPNGPKLLYIAPPRRKKFGFLPPSPTGGWGP